MTNQKKTHEQKTLKEQCEPRRTTAESSILSNYQTMLQLPHDCIPTENIICGVETSKKVVEENTAVVIIKDFFQMSGISKLFRLLILFLYFFLLYFLCSFQYVIFCNQNLYHDQFSFHVTVVNNHFYMECYNKIFQKCLLFVSFF